MVGKIVSHGAAENYWSLSNFCSINQCTGKTTADNRPPLLHRYMNRCDAAFQQNQTTASALFPALTPTVAPAIYHTFWGIFPLCVSGTSCKIVHGTATKVFKRSYSHVPQTWMSKQRFASFLALLLITSLPTHRHGPLPFLPAYLQSVIELYSLPATHRTLWANSLISRNSDTCPRRSSQREVENFDSCFQTQHPKFQYCKHSASTTPP